MHTNPQYEPWVELIGEDGGVSRYDNYKQFIKSTSSWFVKNHLVLTFKDLDLRRFLCWNRDIVFYILRDQFDSVFSPSEVINDVIEYSYENNSKIRQRINQNYFVYRKEPVPFTGKRIGHRRWYCYYKRPKTTQERRWSCTHKEYVRGKRTIHNLSNSWDDIPRGDADSRKSWKNQKKKKQWM